MIHRLFVRLVRAGENRSWSPAAPFVAAAWVAAMRMLGERWTVFADLPLGRSPALWFIHIYTFYVAILLALAAVLARVTPMPWRRAVTLTGMGLLLGVVPPVIDVAIYGPGKFGYEYLSGLGSVPWLLHRPPLVLPWGETLVLWGAVLFMTAFGLWRGASWPRRLGVGAGAYVLILTFQTLLPTLSAGLTRLDPRVAPSEWKVTLFAVAAMLSLVMLAGAERRLLARLPQVLLPVLFVLLGGAVRGALDGPVWVVATLALLLGIGFALANDWYDRREDAAQGRVSPIDADAATLLSLVPLLGVASLVSIRVEAGLCLVGFAAVAYAYHSDTMRLKCVFPLSYKTEGLLAGLCLLAGLAAVSRPGPTPQQLLLALVVAVGTPAALVFKDLKDVDADRSAGVRTAFVVGEAAGLSRATLHRISAALLLVSLLAVTGFAWQRGATLPHVGALAAMSLFVPGVLVATREPQRAVTAGIVGAELHLVLTIVALPRAP